MSYAGAEHDRMLAGLVKPCYVVALDLAAVPPACRVSDGEWVSAWVRWHSLAAGKARHWRVPSMNEQGVLISTSGDVSQGTFVPGLYGNAGPAPDSRDHVERWLFDDGGSLTYDWEAKRYSIVLPSGSVEIEVGSSAATVTDNAVVVTSGAIALDGDVTIYGDVLVNGALRVTADILGGGSIIDTAGNTANHQH
ncbi:phage baseplate assembly protein V [Pseudomonas sp. QTF5]|uniref:phage baseplate assembly protein V n=1 Tax=Pseudomonas sp. QTF5 TaxID=1435425 RepID=UPI0004B593C0|nr:phage baseplate assembly protein V [Pseudomonas sp. QTF5]